MDKPGIIPASAIKWIKVSVFGALALLILGVVISEVAAEQWTLPDAASVWTLIAGLGLLPLLLIRRVWIGLLSVGGLCAVGAAGISLLNFQIVAAVGLALAACVAWGIAAAIADWE